MKSLFEEMKRAYGCEVMGFEQALNRLVSAFPKAYIRAATGRSLSPIFLPQREHFLDLASRWLRGARPKVGTASGAERVRDAPQSLQSILKATPKRTRLPVGSDAFGRHSSAASASRTILRTSSVVDFWDNAKSNVSRPLPPGVREWTRQPRH